MEHIDETSLLIPSISYGISSIRGKRKENEDACLVSFTSQLSSFGIADGAGGHQLGKTVSNLTVKALKAEFTSIEQKSIPYLTELIEKKYRQINDYVYEESKKREIIMASTLALLNIIDDRALISNIGDTKIYLLRNETMTCLTEVHTVAWQAYANGEIEYGAIESHPQAHVLTAALGARKTIEPFIKEEKIENNDIFIICSDGLDDHVDQERLVEYFTKQRVFDNETLNEICAKATDEAIANGSNDNISIIAVQVFKVSE